MSGAHSSPKNEAYPIDDVSSLRSPLPSGIACFCVQSMQEAIPCGIKTPLGMPLVPDVKTIAQRFSAVSSKPVRWS